MTNLLLSPSDFREPILRSRRKSDPIAPRQVEQAARMYQDYRYSLRALAEALNTTRPRLTQALAEYGVEVEGRGVRRALSPAAELEVWRMHQEQKLEVRDIVKATGLNRRLVYQTLTRMGYQPRGAEELNRQYTADFHYFDVLRTEAQAYWLGFFLDGCVKSDGRTVSINQTWRRKAHLERFAAALKSTYPIHEAPTKANGKKYVRAQMALSSRHLNETLRSYGYTERKSLTLGWVGQHVPPHLLRHFLRGASDANGMLGVYTVRGRPVPKHHMSGSRDFIEGVHCTYVRELGVQDVALRPSRSRKRADREEGSYSVAWAAQEDVAKLIRYLYEGATIYLPEKWERVAHLADFAPAALP